LFVLENRLRASGIDPSPLWLDTESWVAFGEPLEQWIEQTARYLAHAIVAGCSVIDFAAAIIDGGFPAAIRARIVAATAAAMGGLDLRGIEAPAVCEGAVGANGRVIGAASLPIFARYLVDPDVLFTPPRLSAP
jgi:predicted NBD/HSP70 family sugar kinase